MPGLSGLEVLERTGLRLYDPEAVRLLQKAGALVSDENRVRIPSGLVEKAFGVRQVMGFGMNRENLISSPASLMRCQFSAALIQRSLAHTCTPNS
jgi:hypothetical protein